MIVLVFTEEVTLTHHIVWYIHTTYSLISSHHIILPDVIFSACFWAVRRRWSRAWICCPCFPGGEGVFWNLSAVYWHLWERGGIIIAPALCCETLFSSQTQEFDPSDVRPRLRWASVGSFGSHFIHTPCSEVGGGGVCICWQALYTRLDLDLWGAYLCTHVVGYQSGKLNLLSR